MHDQLFLNCYEIQFYGDQNKTITLPTPPQKKGKTPKYCKIHKVELGRKGEEKASNFQ